MPAAGVGPTPLEVDGQIPAGLAGTLYRNGPAGNDLSSQLIDGDGAVHRIEIDPAGGCTYRAQYVATPKLLAERATLRPAFRSLGNQRPGGLLGNALRFLGNAANTNVAVVPDGLIALYEGGHPWLLDPDDLRTLGEYDFDGGLGRRPLGALFYSAHPKRDSKGDLWNFGMYYGRQVGVHTYRLDRRGRFHRNGFTSLPTSVHNHDFGVTDRWLVFLLCPARFDRYRFILGARTFHDAVRWRPDSPTYVVLVAKETGARVVIEADPWFSFHIANAYDDGADVIVDVVRYDDMAIWDDFGSFRTTSFDGFDATLWRLRITPGAARIEGHQISPLEVEFPRVDPRYEAGRHRHVYLAARTSGRGLHHALTAVDTVTGATSTWDAGEAHVVSEPVFVPAPAGTSDADGWLLSLVLGPSDRASRLVVLEAAAVEAGPVASATLPIVVPYTFHGAWRPKSGADL